MPNKTIKKIYHWRYGPLTVISNNGSSFTACIDDPDGIIRSDKEYQWKSYIDENPKSFGPNTLGIYIHAKPEDVFKSPHYTTRLMHKYFLENNIVQNQVELENLNEHLAILGSSIKDSNENLEKTIQSIQDCTRKKETETKTENGIIKHAILLNNQLLRIEERINYIKQTRSPREVKKYINELPDLEKKYKAMKDDQEMISIELKQIQDKIDELNSFINQHENSKSDTENILEKIYSEHKETITKIMRLNESMK